MPTQLSRILCCIVVVFLVALPKSGFYAGSTPIYGPYLIVLAITPILLMLRLNTPVRQIRPLSRCTLAIAPFWAVWVATELFIGHENVGYLGGHLFVFILIPTFFYLLSLLYSEQTQATIFRTLTLSIRVVAVFGILSFLHAVLTGDYLNIPYLTTGGGDDVLSVWQRNNQRGDLFKLVSTYNNGNIYGLCMAMLTPLYFRLEHRPLFKAILVASMILTLSRTVWLLTVLALLMTYGERLTLRRFVALVASLIVCATAAIFLSANYLGGDRFLMDSSLGNRDQFFWMLDEFRLMPQEPISAITEIPYLSIYHDFGLIGLVCFALFFISPLLIGNPSPFSLRLRPDLRAVNAGVLIYLFASLSDSALLFVPSFACYGFLAFLKLSLSRRHERTFPPNS
ncbi:O-antigen ligase family protein [Enterobacterales bacterium AE_CKDN230030158-1A_HGKHYDSX7]